MLVNDVELIIMRLMGGVDFQRSPLGNVEWPIRNKREGKIKVERSEKVLNLTIGQRYSQHHMSEV